MSIDKMSPTIRLIICATIDNPSLNLLEILLLIPIAADLFKQIAPRVAHTSLLSAMYAIRWVGGETPPLKSKRAADYQGASLMRYLLSVRRTS
jgi:hypothetical protein